MRVAMPALRRSAGVDGELAERVPDQRQVLGGGEAAVVRRVGASHLAASSGEHSCGKVQSGVRQELRGKAAAQASVPLAASDAQGLCQPKRKDAPQA